jgi:hypothetical protein
MIGKQYMDMMLKEGLQNKFKIIIYLTLSIIKIIIILFTNIINI